MVEKFIPLGTRVRAQETCLALPLQKLPDADRIRILEEQVTYMSSQIIALKRELKRSNNAYDAEPAVDGNVNKHGIPFGTVCTGVTEKSPFKFYLTVVENGYQVGSKIYESLSAAAADVSGVRRSGWTFWKLLGGETLKETFKGSK